jgi:hypothetical protein
MWASSSRPAGWDVTFAMVGSYTGARTGTPGPSRPRRLGRRCGARGVRRGQPSLRQRLPSGSQMPVEMLSARIGHEGGGIGVSVGEFGRDADGLGQLTKRGAPVLRWRRKAAGSGMRSAADERLMDRVVQGPLPRVARVRRSARGRRGPWRGSLAGPSRRCGCRRAASPRDAVSIAIAATVTGSIPAKASRSGVVSCSASLSPGVKEADVDREGLERAPGREAAPRKRWLPPSGSSGVSVCSIASSKKSPGVVRRGVDDGVEELRCGEFVALRSARLPLRRDQNPRRPSASSRWPWEAARLLGTVGAPSSMTAIAPNASARVLLERRAATRPHRSIGSRPWSSSSRLLRRALRK